MNTFFISAPEIDRKQRQISEDVWRLAQTSSYATVKYTLGELGVAL